MKAMLSKVVGGPDSLVLEDVPSPVAGAGQAVIQVKACGVNYPDVLVIEDRYQFKPPRPFSPGGEVAGVVASVGEGVTNVVVGDRVAAGAGSGGMAEELLVDAARLRPIPDAMPFDEASAFIATYGTSYYALKKRAHLMPGESLLVLGAAGGVGVSAVELGAAMGANVIAAASTRAKVDFALARGASSGVVYPTGPFDKDGKKHLAGLFKEAMGPGGVDVTMAADGAGTPSSRWIQASRTSASRLTTACTPITARTAPRTACPQAKYRRGAPAPPRYSRAARSATLAISGQVGRPNSRVNSSSSGSPVSELSRKAATMSSSHVAR